MSRLTGMNATNAHWALLSSGFHQIASQLNGSVIFNVYKDGSKTVVLFISADTLTVKETM